MFKIYIASVVSLLYHVFVFGIGLPFLISYPDTITVMFGIILGFSTPVSLFYTYKIIKNILKKEKSND